MRADAAVASRRFTNDDEVDDSNDPLIQKNRAHNKARFAGAECNDVFWAILWILQLIAILALAIVLFSKFKDELGSKTNADEAKIKLNAEFWVLLAIITMFSVLSAFVWLVLARAYPEQLVWTTLFASVVLLGVLSIVLFIYNKAVNGLLMMLAMFLNLLFIYLIRHRIPFAVAMLEIVIDCVNVLRNTITVAFVMILAQVAWMAVWAIAFIAIMYSFDQDKSGRNRGPGGAVLFFMFLSFFWTVSVLKNIVHVTVAGTVATWYFFYPNAMPPNPTLGAFKRASTYSLGSICLGSLLIAIIRTIRFMVESARNNENEFVRCCIICILDCIESIFRIFNRYAFTQIAIYGVSFCEAGKAVMDMFSTMSGFDAVLNDDILGNLLVWGSLMGGALVGGISALLAKFVMDMPFWGLWFLIGFLMGFAIITSAMEVIDSGVAAVFVCYAEDPRALKDTKEADYKKLSAGMRQVYGYDDNRMGGGGSRV